MIACAYQLGNTLIFHRVKGQDKDAGRRVQRISTLEAWLSAATDGVARALITAGSQANVPGPVTRA